MLVANWFHSRPTVMSLILKSTKFDVANMAPVWILVAIKRIFLLDCGLVILVIHQALKCDGVRPGSMKYTFGKLFFFLGAKIHFLYCEFKSTCRRQSPFSYRMAKRTKRIGILGKYVDRYGSSLRKRAEKFQVNPYSVILFEKLKKLWRRLCRNQYSA